MKCILILLAFAVLGACGVDTSKKDECKANVDPTAKKACASATKDESSGQKVDGESFILRGSITSAFVVNVDGHEYGDMEEYFTAENALLPAMVKDAGYDGFEARFDAAIGFRDLSVGMTVYVQPQANRGYANKTVVAQNETFAVVLPAEAAGDVYQVRAVKRIAVVLTKGQEIKKFCYNFSAIDLEVPYAEKDKPIVLDNFKSSLTTYECVQEPGAQSLEIPANSDTPTPFNPNGSLPAGAGGSVKINDGFRGFLKPGVGGDPSKQDPVYQAFGSASMFSDITQGSNPADVIGRWAYYKYDSAGGACESDANLYEDYDCRLMQGATGIAYFENIRAEYLDQHAVWPTSLAEAYKALGCGFVLATDAGPKCGKIDAAIRGKIAPGTGNLFGNGDGISPLGSHGEWHFFRYVTDGGFCTSDTKVSGDLSCGVLLTSTNKIVFYKNLRPEYLDQAATWPASEADALTSIGCTFTQGTNGPICQ